MTAWGRDERSGQLANKSNPVAEEDEQTLTFTLDEAPKVADNQEQWEIWRARLRLADVDAESEEAMKTFPPIES